MRPAPDLAPLHVFTVSPRSTDPRTYWPAITRTFDLSERHGYSGVLIFTGNDTFVDPWVAAQHLLLTTRHLIPLVAVNPVYMHPFTAAKFIGSYAYAYGRRTWLNMVAGAALSYLRSVGDSADHDTRYERLGEYLAAIRGLLTEPRYSLDGRFYQLDKVQLLPRVDPALLPGLLLSGQSPAALEVARQSGATSMQMLPGTLAAGLQPGVRGIHFGVVAREREADAWAAARRLFPASAEAQLMLELSLANTDAQWKQRLAQAARQQEGALPGYWLEPFRNLKADCPYFVGSRDQVADLLHSLARAGVDTIILDLPPEEQEFVEAARAIERAGLQVQRAGGPAPRTAARPTLELGGAA